jgi:hypothetical protein
MILPSSKRSKSCYDRDIDPLYCAWGLDVYDLFVNTKSDLGPNPNTVDEGARKEYLSLPPEEKERLGFEARLFAKLQELVQHCDRTVSRNQDKLQRELQRQSQKRGSQDYVVDVNEGAVEELLRTEIQVEQMKTDLEEALISLAEVRSREEAVIKELNEKVKDGQGEKKDEPSMKSEEEGGDENERKDEEQSAKNGDQDTSAEKAPNQDEKDLSYGQQDGDVPKNTAAIETLGKLTLEKQAKLCEIANILTQLGPLEDSIDVQLKNLNHVKSDITSDKTVCDVSGNFMSARDADERIAGKYYNCLDHPSNDDLMAPVHLC